MVDDDEKCTSMDDQAIYRDGPHYQIVASDQFILYPDFLWINPVGDIIVIGLQSIE